MDKMKHPYQRLAARQSKAVGQPDILLAASGSRLFSIALQSGVTIDTWPKEILKVDREESNSSTEIITTPAEAANGEPASKRRKTAAKPSSEDALAVSNLTVSGDGEHIILTTGEDKSVHVLSISADGHLQHLSQRQMLKRPCAIVLTTNNDHILVGDKFGDVYALPLHTSDDNGVTNGNVEVTSKAPQQTPTPSGTSATNLTVHTGQNLKSLESQRRQAENAKFQQAREKATMSFKHELLLGHVSMLTDITTASLKGAKSTREYIITADRDEHIRISRGRPQAHIIENYCFGHTQFVSKLCLARPDILVSGGGDEEVFVWRWQEGRLLTKFNIGNLLADYFETSGAGEMPETIAVSGIWTSAAPSDPSSVMVWCACEAVAALCAFHINLASLPVETSGNVLPFDGNVLDLAVLERPDGTDSRQLPDFIVSVDTWHNANSKDPRDSVAPLASRLIRPMPEMVPMYSEDDRGVDLTPDALHRSHDLLYSVEKLRKRGNEEE